ncbi:inner membrane protein [Escherichia coli]|uniref:Inner membrane protein n=1 Tax=Escherichia coli TaxID=562 RepID=A0A376KSQ1_ECOLX|nr:inner membrane protein [Escherichia coli]
MRESCFIASILVPFTKVIVMFTLLLSIHFKCQQGLRTRILLLRMVTWIGRWSMLDLFVISLTMSLINRDQILAFTMGPAGVLFRRSGNFDYSCCGMAGQPLTLGCT